MQNLPLTDRNKVRRVIEKTVKQKTFMDHEFKTINKNGDVIYLKVTGEVELDKNGDVECVCGVIQDVTECKVQKQLLIDAKERAEESDRLKSAFLANLSHEIRTPMNAIIGFSSFFKDVKNTAIELQKYADIIISSGEQLLSLINDIIDISKIDVGQVDLIKKRVNINSILSEVFLFFQSYLISKNKSCIKLYLDIPDFDINIFTDEMRLRQILSNLIGNAIKFTEKGFVKIKLRKQDGYLKFNIEDSGIGIPSEIKDVVFERFYQGATISTTKLYGGTGLGLAIAKACVELLNGQITYKSEVNKGSNFCFTLKE